MSFYGKYETYTFIAKTDLSNSAVGTTGLLHRAINFNTGNIVQTALGADGMLVKGCSSGGHATAAIWGVMKGLFATAITTPGINLTVTTSGRITIAGSGYYVIGKNLTAVSCAGVHPFMGNFLNPWYYNPVENSSGS